MWLGSAGWGDGVAVTAWWAAVAGPINLAHAALTDQRQQPVTPKRHLVHGRHSLQPGQSCQSSNPGRTAAITSFMHFSFPGPRKGRRYPATARRSCRPYRCKRRWCDVSTGSASTRVATNRRRPARSDSASKPFAICRSLGKADADTLEDSWKTPGMRRSSLPIRRPDDEGRRRRDFGVVDSPNRHGH